MNSESSLNFMEDEKCFLKGGNPHLPQYKVSVYNSFSESYRAQLDGTKRINKNSNDQNEMKTIRNFTLSA